MNWPDILNPCIQGFTVEYYSNYWRECGIQPPETCPYDISLKITDPVECSSREQFGHLLSEYSCTPLTRFFSEASFCAPVYDGPLLLQYCTLKDGKYCQEWLYYSNHSENLFTEARYKCSNTRDICTPGCKTILQSL